MKVLISLLISSIAGFATILGGLLIYLKIKKESVSKFITFCLSFSLAIMIGVSITDLIPSAFFALIYNYNIIKGLIIIIVIFLTGYFLITFLNKLMDKEKEKGSSLYKLGILSMIILIIHNFPEGIATFLSSYQNINLGLKLSLAIMLHNIPEGISIAIPIYYATNNKKKALNCTILSAIAEPLGAILAFLILKNYISNNLINIILLFVASLMITLSIEGILPKIKEYNESKYIILGILSGIIVLTINLLLW